MLISGGEALIETFVEVCFLSCCGGGSLALLMLKFCCSSSVSRSSAGPFHHSVLLANSLIDAFLVMSAGLFSPLT